MLIGALATSRFQRVREAVLLKTLGAVRRQVLRIMLAEYAALGVLSAFVAMALASGAGWALTKYVFEVPFSVPLGRLSRPGPRHDRADADYGDLEQRRGVSEDAAGGTAGVRSEGENAEDCRLKIGPEPRASQSSICNLQSSIAFR